MKKVLAVAATTLALIAGGLFSAGAASAKVPGQLSINFAGDAPGVKPNGFSSVAAPKVTFSVAIGSSYFFQIAKLRALRLTWARLAGSGQTRIGHSRLLPPL